MERRLKEIDKEYKGKIFPDEIVREVSYLEMQIERIIDNERP